MNGLEKLLAPIILPLAWMGSLEWRLRSKISKDRFEDLKTQTDRVESHLWDIMQASKIKPSMDVPEKIKNNGK